MSNIKSDASEIIRSAIGAVLPGPGMKKALEEVKLPSGKVIVIAVGKAAFSMAKVCEDVLNERIFQGLVITKRALIRGTLPHFECMEAGHPVPDESSYRAAERAMDMVKDLSANDQVLLLLSGGSASMFEKPLIEEGKVKELTAALKRAGASLREGDTVRKHLSAVKGGRFAALAAPAHVHSIILSDLPGAGASVVACGPACPDKSTSEEATGILEKYGIRVDGDTLAELLHETPKTLQNVTYQLIGSATMLCNAAKETAESLGYGTIVLCDVLNCEAKEAGAFFSSIARTYSGSRRSVAVIAGGKTTVHLTGNGKGGRNQEMALACAEGIDGLSDVCFFSVSSEGKDGPTEAAGGIVDGETKGKLLEEGYRIGESLANNDAYHALFSVRGLVVTGPTGTNVNDLSVLLIKR